MKFDFVIGNPPYQDETVGDNQRKNIRKLATMGRLTCIAATKNRRHIRIE